VNGASVRRGELLAELTVVTQRIVRIRDLVGGIKDNRARANVLLYIPELESKSDTLRAEIAALTS